MDRVEGVPRQLPAQPRHFVGRATELASLDAVAAQARAAAGPVVVTTIGGTPGVGKTALALQWAHLAAPDFPDGQLYVDLRGYGATGEPLPPAEAVRGLLEALGTDPTHVPGDVDARTALYRSRLAGRQMLILLDNARDADQVRPLLPGSGTCLVLVTSRTVLSALVASVGAHPMTLRPLCATESQRLLTRRLGGGEDGAVRYVAARCAHLPLALTIAAARAATQPPPALDRLAAELSEGGRRLDLLDAGDPTTCLRTIFSWSYERLTPAAAELFRLLGVHPGPDVTAAAAASLTGTPIAAVRAPLAELVRAHLLDEHRPGRYTQHGLLRDYAAELCATVDSPVVAPAATRRLLEHYLRMANAAVGVLHRPSPPPPARSRRVGHAEPTAAAAALMAAMAWFAGERAVLLAAVDRAATAGFDTLTWQLASTLAEFLHRRGHWDDWLLCQRAALAAACRLGDPHAQAVASRALGGGYARVGRHAEARRHLEQAVRLFADTGDEVGRASTLADLTWTLGYARHHGGEYGPATEAYQRALDQFRALGDRYNEADTLAHLGDTRYAAADADGARGAWRNALGIFVDLGHPDADQMRAKLVIAARRQPADQGRVPGTSP